MCSSGSEPETTAHFLLLCQNHVMNRSKLLKNVYNLDQTPRNYNDDHLIHILLYGSEKFNFNLKLVSAIFYQIFNFSSNDRPSKTMKNVFYSI